MISKDLYKLKRFCRDDISIIKNYEQAINDTENVWDCHHINELTYTQDELIKMNMYYHRPFNELIFLTKSEHELIHEQCCVGSDKIKEARSKPKSNFGIKFIEHYNLHREENINLYSKEYAWYKRHNKCRWE